MKTLSVVLLLAWAAVAGAGVPTADSLVAKGRNFLSQSNLVAADTNFVAALALKSTQPEANALRAATRLLLLQQQPAISNFLSKLGIKRSGRNLYHWTAEFTYETGSHHRPKLPTTVNSSEAVALIRGQILSAIQASQLNLSRLTNTNFVLHLSSGESAGQTADIDYGDIQVLRALLYCGEFMSYTCGAHNWNVVLNRLLLLNDNETLTIETVLSEYPDLLAKGAPEDLAASKTALVNALKHYFIASDFIRARADQAAHLFQLDGESDWTQEAKLRDALAKVQASLAQPIQWSEGDDFQIYLGSYFKWTQPLRSFMPQFSGNGYVPNTVPDYTLGGLLVGILPQDAEAFMHKHFGRTFEGIYVGEIWGNHWVEGPCYDIGDGELYCEPGFMDYGFLGEFAALVRTNSRGIIVAANYSSLGSISGQFTVDESGDWQVASKTLHANGEVGNDYFRGWYDSTNGNGELQGWPQDTGGPFSAPAGLYSGPWQMGAVSGGVINAVLCNNGDLYFAVMDSAGQSAGPGARVQLDENNSFFLQDPESNNSISGKLNLSARTIAGTFSRANHNGTFALTRTAFIPAPPTYAPPVITRQPTDQVVVSGSNATFTVIATSTLPIYYQWYDADSNPVWPGAAAKLVLPRVQMQDVRGFQVVVANAAGSVTSRVALLTVSPETVKPKVFFTSPADDLVGNNSPVTVQGTATDNSAVQRVAFSVNGQPWQNAESASGAAITWTAQVVLHPGTNLITAKAIDVFNNESAPKSIHLILTSPLWLQTNGHGQIFSKAGTQLVPGRPYTVRALPDANWLFTGWTGGINTNANPLTFIMREQMDLTANFITNGFFAAQGAYNGLFAPEAGVPSLTNSGFLTLTITTQGLASGKLFVAGTNYALPATQFDPYGSATAVIKTPKAPITLYLWVDLQTQSGALYGSVMSGNWHAGLTAYLTAAPQGAAGDYTFVLSDSVDPPTHPPVGDGAGTVYLGPKGGVKLLGSLSEGTPISLATTASRDGLCPVYVSLQAGKSLLWGWLNFETQQGGYDIAGTLYWIRNGAPAMSRVFQGARWKTPGNTQPLLGWTDGTVELRGGGLTTATNFEVQVLNNKLVCPANPFNLKLTALTNGAFTATFTNPTTHKKVVGQGALLQGPGWGGGWFIDGKGGLIRIMGNETGP